MKILRAVHGLGLGGRGSLQVLTEGRRRERLDGNETGDVLLGMRRQVWQNQSQNCCDGGGKGPGA
jgi:hypothetical protein